MPGKTLYDKLWERHEVSRRDDGSSLLYIDRHILHEVTSPQAFEGLRLAGRKPWRVDANLATPDHNVPTTRTERAGGLAAIADETSRIQVRTLDENCADFGILEFPMDDPRAAITLWQKMSRASGASDGPEFLSTHPSAETRLKDLEVYSARVMPLYEQARRR